MNDVNPSSLLEKRIQSLTSHIETMCEMMLPKCVAKYTATVYEAYPQSVHPLTLSSARGAPLHVSVNVEFEDIDECFTVHIVVTSGTPLEVMTLQMIFKVYDARVALHFQQQEA